MFREKKNNRTEIKWTVQTKQVFWKDQAHYELNPDIIAF